MSRDANGDGKVTTEELPQSMRFLVVRADTNKDGGLDKDEAARWAQQAGLGSSQSRSQGDARRVPDQPGKNAN